MGSLSALHLLLESCCMRRRWSLQAAGSLHGLYSYYQLRTTALAAWASSIASAGDSTGNSSLSVIIALQRCSSTITAHTIIVIVTIGSFCFEPWLATISLGRNHWRVVHLRDMPMTWPASLARYHHLAILAFVWYYWFIESAAWGGRIWNPCAAYRSRAGRRPLST